MSDPVVHNHRPGEPRSARTEACPACTAELVEKRAYESAMEAISLLMTMRPEPAKDSTAGLLLDGLANAVSDYEQMKYPIGDPTAEEAAAFRAEQEPKK